MNITHPDKIVLLGFMSHFPVAGVAWQTIHYLIGLQRLGYEVFYVEAHGCAPSKLMRSPTDDGPTRAATYIDEILRQFGFQNRWAYHSLYPESRYFGMSEYQLKELYDTAALIINLHGSHVPTDELARRGRLVYVESDPVEVELELFHKREDTRAYLAPHCAFFTFGENLGNPDCLVPAPEQFNFRPTRQPVVVDFWETSDFTEGRAFTTIGNWRQPWREVKFKGDIYRWSKHFEFLKILDLPQRVDQVFELAMSSASYNAEDKLLLESKGWQLRDALEFSSDLNAYRTYITESRAEFTVAKDQNIRLRSGWFSDRAVTYLAAGRPVVTQETGFTNILPTGEGLFAFSTMDEIVSAVEAVNSEYSRHCRAARHIARDYFSHEVVLGQMLQEVGLKLPGKGSSSSPVPEFSRTRLPLPNDLVVVPVGRWPTRLPEETVSSASRLAVPVAPAMTHFITRDGGASIIMVTCNGLLYTKLCLSTLLSDGWNLGDELIIVDNASTDGTQDYLRELMALNSCVQVIFNKENRGFAAANNQGFSIAGKKILILLNNDTLVPHGWRDRLVRWLEDDTVGLVGPVTNRTCNEAQIDAPYREFGEMMNFAREHMRTHLGRSFEIPMLAMFCVAFRRELLERVGLLDEQFEIGMFEDDDFARRVRVGGYKILCAEDVFVHHFGQASLGELCVQGDYNRVLETNRYRFETKWGIKWQPHGRRATPEYQSLRERIKSVVQVLPTEAAIIVVSKGDDELVNLNGHKGWHFPQESDGHYSAIYPSDSAAAISQMEILRAKGAKFFLIPKPAFWWLDHYCEFRNHLQQRYQLITCDQETCLIYDIGTLHG